MSFITISHPYGTFYKLHPFRYSRCTKRFSSGRLVDFMLGPSHWTFLPTPARIARLPSSTISVSGPA